MSTAPERPLIAELRHELNALRGNWFWFVIWARDSSSWASSRWAPS